MPEREIPEKRTEGRNYEAPALVELGNIRDLTRYDVSVIVS